MLSVSMNQRIQELVNTPMDRKRFLAIVGLGVLTLLGLRGIADLMKRNKQDSPSANNAHYGGKSPR